MVTAITVLFAQNATGRNGEGLDVQRRTSAFRYASLVTAVVAAVVIVDRWPGGDATAPPGLAVQLADRELGRSGPGVAEPSGKVMFGVATPSGPHNLGELEAFEKAARKKPSLHMFHQGWENGEFDQRLLSRSSRGGVLPMVTWEPWDYEARDGGGSQYSLSEIVGGSFDGYIRQWAMGIRKWGRPVAIRFAHEMNGFWYPWAEGVNGNQPGEYIAAWRHVWRTFERAGATNVLWVWSPNVIFPGSVPLERLYPGDEYVDWIGIDGYNGGTALSWGGWVTFDELFGPTIEEVRSFSGKPIVLSEVGSAEAGGSKAEWISDFFDSLSEHPDIIGFIWFEARKQTDWRIVSSEAARAAFASGVADPRYG